MIAVWIGIVATGMYAAVGRTLWLLGDLIRSDMEEDKRRRG